MAIRVLAVCLLAAAAPLTGCGGSSAPRSTVSAKMSGSSEVIVASGAPDGSGSATIRLEARAGKACWKIDVHGIGKPLSAHVHKGDKDEIGPVVIPLGGMFAPSGCVLAPTKTIRAVLDDPGDYYVNVHTREYPNGAIRGQLH